MVLREQEFRHRLSQRVTSTIDSNEVIMGVLDRISNSHNQLEQLLERAECQILELKSKGYIEGGVYFKSKQNTKSDAKPIMFVLTKLKDGKRQYIHIGIDPKKQEITAIKVARYKEIVKLEKGYNKVYKGFDLLQKELEQLSKRYESLLKSAKRNLYEYEKTTD